MESLVATAISVDALGVKTQQDILVPFPKDGMTFGLGTEIVVKIHLPAHVATNAEIENEVADAIFAVVQKTFPKAYVQCMVYKFSTEHGYRATGMGERAVNIAPLPSEIERLQISGRCKAHYSGTWLRPAILTGVEVDQIIQRLSRVSVEEVRNLLIVHGNRPYSIRSNAREALRRALQHPISGKYYRLAVGGNRKGNYASQLWEVQPPGR